MKQLITAFIIFLCCLIFPGAEEDLEKYLFDDRLKAPYTSCLTVLSDEYEKQITTEMLGPSELFSIYNNDVALEKAIRDFQQTYQVPALDYKFCLAGAMTLNLLIEVYINNNKITGSFKKVLKRHHDPMTDPDVRNTWGIEVIELQLMYNSWAGMNHSPSIIADCGEDGGQKLDVDGYFGKFTEAAILNFQKDEELLEVTGIADSKTWKLLYIRTFKKRKIILKELISYSDKRFP